MKVTTYDGSKGRQILTGMITSNRVLTRLAPRWNKEGLFASRWENQVGQWCVDYHKRYHKAPSRNIESLFATWAEDSSDKEQVKLVEQFLSNLSGQYAKLKKKVNPEYIVDQAGEYWNQVRVKKLKDLLEGDIDNGKVASALKRINAFRKVEVGRQESVRITDKGLWGEVLAEPPEPIVKYPGDLARFYGRSLRRGRFVVFMAPMKRGKSFWTFDLAWRAMEQGRRVVYFQLGDLTRDEEMERVAARLTRTPTTAGKYKIPTKLEVKDGMIKVKHDTREMKERLSPSMVAEVIKRRATSKARVDTKPVNYGLIQWQFHPSGSLSMEGIRSIMDGIVHEDGPPDVIALDYMDILARPSGYPDDHRAAVNDNWMNARRLSQELNCLVVASTQANAASFKAETLRMEHFSEDNRKYAHVNTMYAINQKIEEKEKEVYRLTTLVNRGEQYSMTRACYTAGSLAIADPAICSKYPSYSEANDE